MKKTILILAAVAMAASSTLASAQSYGGRDGRNDGRNTSRNDNRGTSQFRSGQRLDERYRSRDREVNDWSRYRLSAPPRGYRYYRTDSGDIVLAAIASGIISLVIADQFNNNNGYNSRSYGYNSGYGYGYAPPPPYQAYGPIYSDAYGRPYTVDRYGRSVWVR